MKKLAIITTHPIQYYAPVFSLLHSREKINIQVFYTLGNNGEALFDPGFRKMIAWDIPLLEGYPYQFVPNVSKNPGSDHNLGVINPDLKDRIVSFAPDAILVFGWSYHSHLKIMRYFKNKVPVFFRGDSTLLDHNGGIKDLFKLVYLRWIYSHVDHAFFVGTENKKYFQKYGLKENQLSFAPHAVDNMRFSTDLEMAAASLRAAFAVGLTDIMIIFAGKLEPKKSPGLLLSAFTEIAVQGVHLLIVGNGVLKPELLALAGTSPNVHFMDFQNQSEMPIIYQAGDLFCLPSSGPGESWGLAVNEAMACSKAILVSDKVGCATDLVKPGHNGFIFKSGNEVELKEYLSILVQSRKRLKKFGQVSGELIKSWTFETIAEAIENKMLNETN